MKAGANKQRGISFTGFILIAVAGVFVVIVALKIVPAYMHNAQIQNVLNAIANDPEMQNASVKDVRMSYTKRASVDYIGDISADDLDVSKEGGRLSLSANYTVKIPVAGNISLVLEFNPSAPK